SIISTIAGSYRHPDDHPVLSFKHWADITDEKPELMAGQHRVEALRSYVNQTASSSDDLWWICEFYDRDGLADPGESSSLDPQPLFLSNWTSSFA
ncbi:unnamed protein product, partial [Fusarium langsethiae]